MAEQTKQPVYDPTGKNVPVLPEPDPPTGTAVVPPDPATEPPPRREGVVSNPDGAPGPEVSRP
jgi:hypothetical protein